jgi:exonuclease III
MIDHIILGGHAADGLLKGIARMLVFKEADKDSKKVLSDHCPVSVRLEG